jgi:OmpA-OmpF porin, OOP family
MAEPARLGPRLQEALRLKAQGPEASDARFVLVGLFGALVVALLTTIGPHQVSAFAVEDHLQAAAQRALRAPEFASISVKMKGQTAVLEGAAPTADAGSRAAALVLKSSGRGGWWHGGVTRVVNHVSQAGIVSPFDWKAVRNEKVITITGHVPSETDQATLLKRTQRLFPGNVHDESIVAAGAPSGDWLKAARSAIDGLAVLPNGDARLVDRRLILMGEADRAAVDKVKSSFAKLDLAPFEAVLDVSVSGEGPPELAGIKLAGADANTCQEAFTRIMAANVINFDTGSAVIAAASLRVLDNLASIARRCDAYSIEVSGHTDNVGGRDLNVALSKARADAVVNYLAARGVTGGRLSAVGYGPDRPLSTNATSAGQAQNRRIEFAVHS